MLKTAVEKYYHRAFEVGVLLKGLNGFLESAGGTLLLFIKPATINKIVLILTQSELIEDPNDRVFNYLRAASAHLTPSAELFGAFYLLIHGAIKILLVAGLLKKKPWAYPASLSILTLFVFYQLYQISYSHSVGLILLTIFDALVIFLVWHEYIYTKGRILKV
jgi:uncharacterized membrane protein